MTYSEKKDQFHDRVLRRIIVFLVVAAFAVPLLTPRVFAASTVSISGGDQVKGGETFTVTVTYSGAQIGSVNGSMTYDTNKLNYLSGGSSSGNTGSGTDGGQAAPEDGQRFHFFSDQISGSR